MAFLDIVFELTFIFGTVNVRVFAVSIGHVIFELTLVYVTFGMPERALTFRLVEVPLAFVMRSVRPVLNTVAVSEFLNIGIVVHSAVSVVLARSIATIIAIGDFHLRCLIALLHLSPVY